MQLHQHLRSLQTHGSLRHRRFRSAEHQLQTPVIEDTFQAQGYRKNLPVAPVHICDCVPRGLGGRPVSASLQESTGATRLKFRTGTAGDAKSIAALTFKESMNPLGLKPERFVVAVDESGNDTAVLGFGQLQPHGNEQQPDFLELRTLIVDPAHRREGIGTQVVQKLLEGAEATDVFLTTLQNSIPFYSPHGFVQIPLRSAPRSLWFEIAAGLVVARIVAKQGLVVLKRPAQQAA